MEPIDDRAEGRRSGDADSSLRNDLMENVNSGVGRPECFVSGVEGLAGIGDSIRLPLVGDKALRSGKGLGRS